MKKSLIALAALSAVAGSAAAQSSVTVYGIIDYGYSNVETNVAGTRTDTTSLKASEASSSRLGFRGTEDLGGGLKANFVAESSIADNTALTFGGRAFWVGLQGGFGELRAGRQNTFARDVWLANDQLAAANVVGNLAHSTVLATGVSTSAHTDFSNAVNYTSPTMSGLQLKLGVAKNTVDTNGAKVDTGTGTQVGANFDGGKFKLAAAYSKVSTNTAAVASTAATFTQAVATTGGTSAVLGVFTQTAASVAATAATDVDTKTTSVGANYDLGVAKVAYVYTKVDAKDAVSTSAAGNVQRVANAFSVAVPVSAKLNLLAGYGMGTYQAGGPTAYKGDMTGYQAGLNYNLSKRTTAYAIYGNEKRETNATAEVKATEYSVGLRHSF
jgi:predicted porin